jgi:hypothetical protein
MNAVLPVGYVTLLDAVAGHVCARPGLAAGKWPQPGKQDTVTRALDLFMNKPMTGNSSAFE